MDVFWIDFHFCEGTQYYFHEVRSLNYYLYAIGVSVLALLFAAYLYVKNASIKVTNARMAEIAGYISDGAMAYLKRQYIVLAAFIVVMFAILCFTPGLGLNTSICFVVGALFSIGAGFFGMKAATKSNVRTAQSAETGLKPALDVAFAGGADVYKRQSVSRSAGRSSFRPNRTARRISRRNT